MPSLYTEGYPNESSLLFLEDDTCYCLLRRDGQPNSALLGTAKAPYTDWQWKDLGQRIGGPHIIRLPDGRIVAAVRLIAGERPVEIETFVGYLLTTALFLPAGVSLARMEPTRWGSVISGGAAITVAVLTLRSLQVWTPLR